MRTFTRSPFSLGLICGLMASACWGLPHVEFLLPYGSDWRRVALLLGWALGRPLFLALPGFILRRESDRYVGLFAVVGIGFVLLTAPHLLGKPTDIGPLSYLPGVQLACLAAFILLAVSLLRPPDCGATEVVLTTFVAVAGAAVIGAAAVALVPTRFVCHELTLPEAVIIVLIGPWLGVAMWSFGTAGRRKEAADDA